MVLRNRRAPYGGSYRFRFQAEDGIRDYKVTGVQTCALPIAASKHAVEGMTKSAALEAARFGVRVNAVAPGPTETAMLNRFTGTAERKAALATGVPLGRIGEPEEIARAIVFLASAKASFVTGQVLTADGGKTAG